MKKELWVWAILFTMFLSSCYVEAKTGYRHHHRWHHHEAGVGVGKDS